MTIGVWGKVKIAGGVQKPRICDLMISDGELPDAKNPCDCSAAILNGDLPIDTPWLTAKRIITYGLCARNTVTVSGIGDKKLLVCLREEILNLERKRVCAREFYAENRACLSTEQNLALAAVNLVMG